MDKIYTRSFVDKCPYTLKNETIIIKFAELQRFDGHKALDVDCSAKACSNRWECPIYLKNK